MFAQQQIGSLGPLEYVINTPSHHRMHHRCVIESCLWCLAVRAVVSIAILILVFLEKHAGTTLPWCSPPGNCNYAGVLIIWDRIFGTFVAEDAQRDLYGLAQVSDEHKECDVVVALLNHYAPPHLAATAFFRCGVSQR
jgi:hypothetical protein